MLVYSFHAIFRIINEAMKTVSECFCARMFPLCIFGTVITYVKSKDRCGNHAIFVGVRITAQLNALDRDSGEFKLPREIFILLDMKPSRV